VTRAPDTCVTPATTAPPRLVQAVDTHICTRTLWLALVCVSPLPFGAVAVPSRACSSERLFALLQLQPGLGLIYISHYKNTLFKSIIVDSSRSALYLCESVCCHCHCHMLRSCCYAKKNYTTISQLYRYRVLYIYTNKNKFVSVVFCKRTH